MGNSLQVELEKVEKKWFSLLFRYNKQIFEGVFLPSHDHIHHARVWSFARRLLLLLNRSGTEFPPSFIEELIIAVFFHDVGLTRTPGELHGIESRILCEEFIKNLKKEQNPPRGGSLERILHSIEHHDDKSPRTGTLHIRNQSTPDLLSLLSASDDLDAFGLMGIYRYAEIYLLRGIRPEDLPGRVCSNVQNRFENLKNSFRGLEEFLAVQESRFRQVYDFYLRLSQAYASSYERTSWEPVLIRIIYEALQQQQNLLDPERMLPRTNFSKELEMWFKSLDEENPYPEKADSRDNFPNHFT